MRVYKGSAQREDLALDGGEDSSSSEIRKETISLCVDTDKILALVWREQGNFILIFSIF
jgi:hypothetical protein